jgi:hypothetical protein
VSGEIETTGEQSQAGNDRNGDVELMTARVLGGIHA